MIQITKPENCCGCEACIQRCPVHCISLHEDNEGFFYPFVNKDSCINCGMCEQVCPELNKGSNRPPLLAYAAINTDENIRKTSSSGGIFSMLAKDVINDGGVVFGALWDNNWTVKHDYVENLYDLAKLRGSKYMQSRIYDCYTKIEILLKSGCKVMFVGTPCQAKGLKLFLGKTYPKLLVVDLVCHGVPSTSVWLKYLNETINNRTDEISEINFRSKHTGWKYYSLLIKGKDGKALLSENFNKNLYMRAFLHNIILRPSCYNCVAKEGRSGSDITLADFWGIDDIMPELYDDCGTSLVIINTEKGKSAYKKINAFSKSFIIDENIKRFNGGLNASIPIPQKRQKFFTAFAKGKPTVPLLKKILKPSSLRKRIKMWWKQNFKKFGQ